MGPAGNGYPPGCGSLSRPLPRSYLAQCWALAEEFFSLVIFRFHKICQLARRKALVPPGVLLHSTIPEGIKHFSTRLESGQL